MADQRINPYRPGNPVNPVHITGRIPEITEFLAQLEAAKKGYPVSIFVKGEWGIGMTSLLKKLHPEFREHGIVIREDVPALELLTYLDGKLYVREGPRSIELSGEEMGQFVKERNTG